MQAGRDDQQRARLKDAAVYLIKGYRGVSKNDPNYNELRESYRRGRENVEEQQILQDGAKEFGYNSLFEYGLLDRASDKVASYDKVLTKVHGGVKMVSGGAGVVGSGAVVASGPATGGISTALGVAGVALSADDSYQGYRELFIVHPIVKPFFFI